MPEGEGTTATDEGQQTEQEREGSQEGASDDAERGEKDEASKKISKLNSEAKANRLRAEKAEAELAEIKKSQMSDLERLTAESKEKDDRINSLTAEARDLRLEGKVVAAATKAKAVDPVLVFRSLDKSQVEYDGDNPTNLDTLIGELKKAHPVLFQRVEGSGDGGARRGGTTSGGMNDLIRQGAHR